MYLNPHYHLKPVIPRLLLIVLFAIINSAFYCVAQPSDQFIKGQLFVKIEDYRSINISFDGNKLLAFDDEKLLGIVQKFGVDKISKPFILDNEKLQKTYLVEFDKDVDADELLQEQPE